MRRVLVVIAALVLCSCAESAMGDPRGRADGDACYLAIGPVVDAWEALVGPVPERCRDAMGGYALEVLPAPEFAARCSEAVEGGPVPRGACTSFRGGFIAVADRWGESMRVDLAVHEWVHVVARCVGADPEDDDASNDHADLLVWGARGGNVERTYWHDESTVVGLATTNALVGPCVGATAAPR